MTTMNPAPELAPQLKQLRLSGILDSLEARNREASQGKLAYTDFLALLISDEVARREQKKFSSRLRRAQFRTTKTLDQFDFERLPNLNRALVHDLATGRYLHEKAPVLIVGPCGTGKSHLAQALGHCAVRQGVDVIFTTCTTLLGFENVENLASRLLPIAFAAISSVKGVIFTLVAPDSATECSSNFVTGSIALSMQGKAPFAISIVKVPSKFEVVVPVPVSHLASTVPLEIATPVAAIPESVKLVKLDVEPAPPPQPTISNKLETLKQ